MSTVFPEFDPEKPPTGNKRGRFRPVSIRVLIPNILTLLGLCAGMTAIRMAIEGRWDLAVAGILIAAVIDGIDGRAARLLRVSSRFGAELDSLADFVNFGVAPAIIIFNWALVDLRSFGWIVVMAYSLCAVFRLARFNVALDDKDQPAWKSNYFTGIPAPAAALTLLLPLYLGLLGVTGVINLTPLILVYTLVIGFLMVSRIPTFSGKLIGQRVRRDMVLPIIILVVMFMAALITWPWLTLTVGTLVYLAVIPVSAMRYRRIEARMVENIGDDKADDNGP